MIWRLSRMANRRVKSSQQIIPIKDWQDADERIQMTGVLQQRIARVEEEAGLKIDKIKAELAEIVSPYQKAIKVYICSLEAFAVAHPEQFKDKRSRKLNFGVLGWRKSTSISIKKTTLDLIKKVFPGTSAARFIRVNEAVDKDGLAKLTDGQLASIKARRVEKDVFFVEPDLPEAADLS